MRKKHGDNAAYSLLQHKYTTAELKGWPTLKIQNNITKKISMYDTETCRDIL